MTGRFQTEKGVRAGVGNRTAQSGTKGELGQLRSAANAQRNV